MKKILNKIYLLSLLLISLPARAEIESPGKLLVDAGNASGLENADFVVVIGKVINAGLVAVGIVLLIAILYGGFVWMTAGGNEEKVTKAKNIFRNSILGLLVISLSYAITNFIFRILLDANL